MSDLLLEFDPQPFNLDTITLIREMRCRDAGEVKQKVDALISNINHTGRQEERIAILMLAILADPVVGKGVYSIIREIGQRLQTGHYMSLNRCFYKNKEMKYRTNNLFHH